VQEYTKITESIANGAFFKNKTFLEAFEAVKKNKTSLHLMGLVSDGGVHSHIEHLKALLKMAKENKVKDIYIHAFLDGRDCLPRSAKKYIIELQDLLASQSAGELATICGRYYALDRDNRWDRTQIAYDMLVNGKGSCYDNALAAIDASYDDDVDDEFIAPSILKVKQQSKARIKPNDAVIFFNFRSDRTRQLTSSFILKDFDQFERGPFLGVHFVCMTKYDVNFKAPVAFSNDIIKNTLGEVLSENGLKQLRIAETDKYPHVSFFFSGGREEPFNNEDRIMIPTPQVMTYDLKPQMSAYEVTEKVIEKIYEGKYDFIVLNYANADMVGHSGYLDSAIMAVEVVDKCVGLVVAALIDIGGLAIITADHGNAEEMLCNFSKNIITAHTNSNVPFIICDEDIKIKNVKGELSKLGDIAPTILDILSIRKPREMTGNSLLIK
jgi:2,3-bisphosphoglycerate-independent phosphoglycerate mutase